MALAKFGLEPARSAADDLVLQGGTRRRRRRSATRRCARARPRRCVELRFELDTVVSVANVPHVLDTRDQYTCTPLRLTAWRSVPTRPDDPLRHATPETQRAYLNTDDWLLGRADRDPARRRRRRRPRARGRASCPPGERSRSPTSAATRRSTASSTTRTITPERYCAHTTIAAQRNIFLTIGSVLRSNEGRPLLEIVDDTCGRHDTIGGACSQESNTLRYGHHTKHQHACVENFLFEGARSGASASATSSATSTGS